MPIGSDKGNFIKPGFLPLTVGPLWQQYSGKWNPQTQGQANAAGTWAQPPSSKRFTWGGGASGQTGLGNTTLYSSPVQAGTDTWADVATGWYAGGGIKSTGTLWMWGANGSGRLGIGASGGVSAPTQVGALTNWLKVSCTYSSYGIKTDGSLWAWGLNSKGQLGQGNTTTVSSPVQVGALTDWLATASSYGFAIMTKTDGTLWAMGRNHHGQLGDGTTGDKNSPVQIGALTDWLSIACGQYTSFGVRSSGTMYSWGISGAGNFAPNLGQNRSGAPSSSSPTQIGALTTWLAVAAGTYNILAVKTDGTLWAWGVNGFGTANNASSPVQVGVATTWTNKIAAGSGGATGDSMMAGIQSDGTLWTWGFNNSGQLGDGSTVATTAPAKVGALTTWLSVSASKAGVQARGTA